MATKRTTYLFELPPSLKLKAKRDGKARDLKLAGHLRKLIRDYEREAK